MGGKNHQPCRQFLASSTKMSRAVSLATIQIEMTNVALEDILIEEMSGGRSSIDAFLAQVRVAYSSQNDILAAIAVLEDDMSLHDYKDLPPLHTLDLSSIGKSFESSGLVDYCAYTAVKEIFVRGSFYAVLKHFRQAVIAVKSHINSIAVAVESLREDTTSGNLELALEENHSGNLRVPFARLYTSWDKFQQEFLASSLISTEVWYAFNGFGSLTKRAVLSRAA